MPPLNDSPSDAATSSPLPDNIYVPPDEWEKLDETSRKFLVEAEAGGMGIYAENGEVCAWGAAYAGIFSIDVEARRDPDGYLVTPANVQAD